MTTDDTTTDGQDEQDGEICVPVDPTDYTAAGRFVDDREDTGTLVVVAKTGRPANSHAIATVGETVAELNPEYPPDDEVVFCAYRNALDATFGVAWREYKPTFLAHQVGDKGVPVYSFPETRLAPKPDEWVDTIHRDDDEEGEEEEKADA